MNTYISEGLKFTVRGPESRDAIIVEQVVKNNIYQLPDDLTGQLVLDIGGHIGSFALACAKRGATVYSFEPERETYVLLLENIWRNSDTRWVLPFNIAIGRTGLRELYHAPLEHGISSFTRKHSPALTDDSEKVWTVSLDQAFRRIGGKCHILKLDCEGAEDEILPEIADGLYRRIPTLLIEFHQPDDKMDAQIERLKLFYESTPLSHVEYKFTLKEQHVK